MARINVADQARRAVASVRVREYLTVWVVVVLTSGQGFRYLLGIPVYGLICLLTLAAVVVTFRTTGKRLDVPFLIKAFVGLAALSVMWSATRGITLIAVLVMIVITYVAVATVRGASTGRFMELLYRGLQISLFAGIVFELIVAFIIRQPIVPLVRDLARIPGVGPEVAAEIRRAAEQIVWSNNMLLSGGPIQGFVGNRNPFGAIALFVAIVAVVLLLEKRIRRTDAWVTLSAALAVHVLTLSATVMVSAVFLGGLLLAVFAIRAVREPFKRTISFGTLAFIAVAGVLTLKFREEIFLLFDRRSDATNRTGIWDAVVKVAFQHPEGFGYVGYWPVWDEPYSGIADKTGHFAAHAHNAYLDAWLQLGLVGLALLLVIVVVLFGSMWRLVERAGRNDTFIPVAWSLLTATLVLQALTESRLLVEGGWFLLVALYCSGPQLFKLTIVDPELVHSAAPSEPDPD